VIPITGWANAPQEEPRAIDARGYRLLPQPEALFDLDGVFGGEGGGHTVRIGASTRDNARADVAFHRMRMWNPRIAHPTPMINSTPRSISYSGRNLMMTKSTVVAAIVFSLAIGAGAALAQNPSPAAHQAAAGATDKQAISKSCSDLAWHPRQRGSGVSQTA
jgi:hypothetical protein